MIVLARRRLHGGRVFEVLAESIRLPSGRGQELDIVRHPGAVAIAALDDDGRLVLVRQYRHALERETLEIPAGRLEKGEEPLAAARRELEEETGLVAGRWERLRVLAPAPGFCSERVHLFRAESLREVAGGGLPPDADEEIRLERRRPEEIVSSTIEDAKTLIAALLVSGRGPL